MSDERRAFLDELFVDDLETIMEWHRTRSSTEQKRLMKVISSLYKFHKLRKDGVNESAPSRKLSKEAPSLEHIQPIDIHNAHVLDSTSDSGRRSTYSGKSLKSEDLPLSIRSWMNKRSIASPRSQSSGDSTGTYWTGVSDMTPTTEGSTCSVPLNISRLHYHSHRRAFALNRRMWHPTQNHISSSNIPTNQYPAERQFVTDHFRFYGKPVAQVSKTDIRHYRDVFRSAKHEFILAYVAQLTSKEAFGEVVRALHTLRRTSMYNTTAGWDYDLKEDTRFWKPTKAAPAKSLYELFASKVPLGTLAATIKELLEEEAPQVELHVPHAVTHSARHVEEMSDVASEITATDASHVTLEMNP